MNRKKLTVYTIIVALIAVTLIWYNRGSDIYAVQYGQGNFRSVYMKDYSSDSANLPEYCSEDEAGVRAFVKCPITLGVNSKTGEEEYRVELQYRCSDDSTRFKIFASDYISEDNSGGKILLNETLDPNKTAVVTSIKLDQPCDSVTVLIETKDNNLQIGRFNMSSATYIWTDTYFFIALTVLCRAVVIYILNAKKLNVQGIEINGETVPPRNTVILFVAVAVIAVLISSLPFLNGGLILGHDTMFHLNRIEGIARGLKSGQFPVRIHGGTLNDYGYPNSIFYPELLLYVPAVLNLFGVSVYTAYKVYVIMINFLTVILSYIAFKKFTDSRQIGLTLAVVYLLSPYRIICAYYRQAIGEFTAITFLPLVVYGLYAVTYGKKEDWLCLAAGATGVLQSHILSTEITACFAFIFILFGIRNYIKDTKRILPLVKATVATVLLNLWSLAPMVMMMLQNDLRVFERAPLTASMASLKISRLFGMNEIIISGPYMIGIVILIAMGIYMVHRIIHSKENTPLYKMGDMMWVMTFLHCLCTTSIFPWAFVEKIPLIGTIVTAIQFPMRLLQIAQICGIMLLGVVLVVVPRTASNKKISCFIIVLIAVFTNLQFMEKSIITSSPDNIQGKSYFNNNIDNRLSVGEAEYIPTSLDIDEIIAQPPTIKFDNKSVAVENYKHHGTKLSFDYQVLSEGNELSIYLPFIYFPNYEVEVNGVKVQPTKSENACVMITTGEKRGSVSVRYVEPKTFRIFEIISVASLAYIIYARKKKKLN